MDQETGCPGNYEELFVHYFPMMVGIVTKSGIASEDVEDVAMDILARFIEKGGIAYYDPERLNDVGDNPDLPGPRLRRAKFKGMLRGFTATYVMQYRDKQMIRHKYFPYRLDRVVILDKTSGEKATFAELIEHYDNLESTERGVCILAAVKRSREALLPLNTKTRDYGHFVDLCVEYGFLDGKLDRKALKRRLKVSDAVLTSMLRDLREVMRPMLAEAGLLNDAVAS